MLLMKVASVLEGLNDTRVPSAGVVNSEDLLTLYP